MRNLFNALLTGALISGALAGGNAATAEPSGTLVAERKPICDNGFFAYRTPTVLPPNIEGYGWAKCDLPSSGDPGLTHDYYLSLQRRNASGGWDSVGQHERTSLVPWARQTYTVSAPCTAGYWRIYSSVSGTIQGRPYGPVETTSDERVVTAADCGQ
ncbi:hypothetical protein [Nocardia vulneris]|uniref:hypothetical protein n=1 Tax=Nocardia vulneris TaxID=1141657 RepID=UPI000A9FA6F6|nr:hypothetical protein [Nocardia vulneris]